jgi:hypothetical protein
MIFWRIRFDSGSRKLDTELGYLALDQNLNAHHVCDDNGKKIKFACEYTTLDSGDDPTEGVTPPEWADKL